MIDEYKKYCAYLSIAFGEDRWALYRGPDTDGNTRQKFRLAARLLDDGYKLLGYTHPTPSLAVKGASNFVDVNFEAGAWVYTKDKVVKLEDSPDLIDRIVGLIKTTLADAAT